MSKYDMEWHINLNFRFICHSFYFYLIKNTISYNLRLLKNKDILGMSLYKMIRDKM